MIFIRQKSCGKCIYLIPKFRLCTKPKIKNSARLLKKSGQKFVQIPSCGGPYKKHTGKNKYHAKSLSVNGIDFDSKAEYTRYVELNIAQKAGAISELSHHKKFLLLPSSEYGPAIYYESDYSYIDKTGKLIVEDVKSTATKTSLYKLKKRLMAEKYNINITEIYEK